MKIVQGWRSDPDRPLTDPLPEKKWCVEIRFLGGDWLDPMGVGTNWFSAPFPKRVLHVWWPLWLSYALAAIATFGLLLDIMAGPVWSWPLAFVAWLMIPGKQIMWRFDKHGGYAGFKPYGVDAPVYALWLCDQSEVYPGSLAVCLSIRPWATLND